MAQRSDRGSRASGSAVTESNTGRAAACTNHRSSQSRRQRSTSPSDSRGGEAAAGRRRLGRRRCRTGCRCRPRPPTQSPPGSGFPFSGRLGRSAPGREPRSRESRPPRAWRSTRRCWLEQRSGWRSRRRRLKALRNFRQLSSAVDHAAGAKQICPWWGLFTTPTCEVSRGWSGVPAPRRPAWFATAEAKTCAARRTRPSHGARTALGRFAPARGFPLWADELSEQ